MSPEHSPQSVVTPPAGLPVYCPVCHTVPLKGKQTVCSAKCRIQRSMATRAAKRRERDAQVRVLLTEALALLTPDKEP
jgi:predicted nucleic acid-binding Zn ribbon protein